MIFCGYAFCTYAYRDFISEPIRVLHKYPGTKTVFDITHISSYGLEDLTPVLTVFKHVIVVNHRHTSLISSAHGLSEMPELETFGMQFCYISYNQRNDN